MQILFSQSKNIRLPPTTEGVKLHVALWQLTDSQTLTKPAGAVGTINEPAIKNRGLFCTSSAAGRWHRLWPLRIAYPYHASVVTALSRFLQLSAPARHGKTWHHLFLSIVRVGWQSVLIHTWCILSYASLGFTLSVWDSCHLHGPDKWACTQCELRS